jgi:hypothetical protein
VVNAVEEAVGSGIGVDSGRAEQEAPQKIYPIITAKNK